MTAATPSKRAQRWTIVANGHRIRELRRQCGLAQAELAGLAGVSLDTVARLDLLTELPDAAAAQKADRPGPPVVALTGMS